MKEKGIPRGFSLEDEREFPRINQKVREALQSVGVILKKADIIVPRADKWILSDEVLRTIKIAMARKFHKRPEEAPLTIVVQSGGRAEYKDARAPLDFIAPNQCDVVEVQPLRLEPVKFDKLAPVRTLEIAKPK